jgi:cytochrome c peroxidase
MKKRLTIYTAALTAFIILGAFFLTPANAQDSSQDTKLDDQKIQKQAQAVFKPLPETMPASEANPTTAEKVQLGKKLYYDPRLSLSGVISCNTCHNLATYGSDNVETSLGHNFQTGGRNAPTVLNAGTHIAQFWDGREPDLEGQAKGPVLNPLEMAMPDSELVIQRLNSIPEYREEFALVFKGDEPVNYDNVANAIAAFERTLVTPSRFDDYLNGNNDALTQKEKEGLQLFMTKACITCHNGGGVGGSMYQKFGVVKPYKNQEDLGRYKITNKEADKYVFKVPSLRNITRTYPYFHDGQVWDIREAVYIMGESQLGMQLSDEEISNIVIFLDSLTGEIPEDALKLPVLPPSTAETSKPKI